MMMVKYKNMCIILNMVHHLGFFFKYNLMETDSVLEICLKNSNIMVGVKNNGHIHATGYFKQVVFLSIHYTMLELQKMMAVSLQQLMVRMAPVLLVVQLGHVYLLLIPWSGILSKHHLVQQVRDQLKSWMLRLSSY
jgi:hypothetical protein